ncbi:DNA cytosine methyltransferase [Aeromicrobium endophyticum]|uniref:DNA cytosine methyltransferase n=1 Tax=Aeromicrobium endophyticum TaxID=2292704 RepID=A0A371PCK7_9ACTN|nr:DNA cytosine methyltransferase [Aeromicrobium endophyticum]REK73674.1 DNA cytosine methyltransferase [Aeromicrobium endophyticum]
MSARPKVLDLFACEGGASEGYRRAGFDVYAVDLDENRLKRNPSAKHLGDALAVLRALIDYEAVWFTHPDGQRERLYLRDFVFGHASPPCQGYTRGNAGKVTAWPKLIPDVRAQFVDSGLPYVIENVRDAGPEMVDPVGLCGCMFDLRANDVDGEPLLLTRWRLFETNFPMSAPRECDHSSGWIAGAYGGSRRAKREDGESLAAVAPRDRHEARYVRKGGYVPRSREVLKALLGIDHDMTLRGLHESIPPAYAEHVGRELLASLAQTTIDDALEEVA